MGTRALPHNFWRGFLKGSLLAQGNRDCLPSARWSVLAENLKNCFRLISQSEAQIRWLSVSGWCYCPSVCPSKNLCICWRGFWTWWDRKNGVKSWTHCSLTRFMKTEARIEKHSSVNASRRKERCCSDCAFIRHQRIPWGNSCCECLDCGTGGTLNQITHTIRHWGS